MTGTYRFWGKLDRVVDPPRIHPLSDHCIDVAATFRCLAGIPALRRRLDTSAGIELSAAQLDRLAVIAMLHDLGKCNCGFQAKRDPNATQTAGHVDEAAALLGLEELHPLWPLELRNLLTELCEWFCAGEEQAFAMLLAAISHHGRPVSIDGIDARGDRAPRRWWEPRDGVDPAAGLRELVAGVRITWPSAFARDVPPIEATAALQHRFAGLVMLADWIGSDTAFFPYRQDEAEDRPAFARRATRRAVTGIGIALPSSRQSMPFARTFGFAPSALQAAMAHQLEMDDDARLVLVESETGSGKTEAALAWHLRLYAAGRVDALYFALPTRVAARELYGRVCRAVESAFPDPLTRPGPVLLAAPGYVRVDGDAPGCLPQPEGRLWEDDAAERRHERQWSAAHPKRFLAAPIAVGTIDQALLSALQVKHALLRSVCLDRSLLVVDEVHASDPYMRQALQALLDGHLRRGGHALLLSATLGESACSVLFGRPMKPLAEAERRPYPSVSTHVGERHIEIVSGGKQVEIEFVHGFEDEAVLPRIAEGVATGARVLVVCNTVARANAMLRAIEAGGRIDSAALFAVGGVACPHHGRFARDHREVMDAAVTAALGKSSPSGPRLLIGTQTLEQSLDIDADLLVTDLCPMDVLLQRIGRLHRHRREFRPHGYTRPRVLLRGPADGDLRRWLRADGSLHAPAGLGRVYADGRVLQRTLDLLRESPLITIPADNRRLVEQTTHPEAWQSLPPEWRRHGEGIVEGKELAMVRAAMSAVIQEKPFGEFHYVAPDERVSTRLGGTNLDLPLAHPMSQPFGILARRLGIPAHMAPGSSDTLPEAIDAQEYANGLRFALGERRYRYTRFGLEIDDA